MAAKITDLIRTITDIFSSRDANITGLFISHTDANSHIPPEMLFAAGLLHKPGTLEALDWSQWEFGLKKQSQLK